MVVSYVLLDMMAYNWVKRLSLRSSILPLKLPSFDGFDDFTRFARSCADTSVLRSRSFFHAIVSFALRRCCAKRGKAVNVISIVANGPLLCLVVRARHINSDSKKKKKRS